jgi:anti-sigma regulatory factor (Ser/Thr protein kinase)
MTHVDNDNEKKYYFEGRGMNPGMVSVPNSFRDPYKFESVINLMSEEGNGGVLNMERVSFIEPYSMLSFLLLGKQYMKDHGQKLLLKNVSLPVNQYLTRMDFFKEGYFDIENPINEKMKLKRSSFSKRVLEVMEIPAKERESITAISKIISVFRKRAEHILKYWIDETIIDYFITVISELCQNIFEHSLDSGYLAMQTYTYEKENIVQLAIADSGIGIRQSFENNTDRVISSTSELIKEAFTTPISSKRKFGYGLCQVNSIVELLHGDIFIRSGDGYAGSIKKNKQSSSYFFLKDNLVTMRGTQISILLSTGR